ncbi:glycine--tRNA ligase subunit beta [Erythrobacter sp.]|uniref:glycine--tRNA ligase subunit beta n=1 Tax=Erythrobacter sp. TaxID=1042 RepID=UPI001B1B0D51|nr:glycine--tRNA ligase subunit beta [Erythrobacter sp.]MBO6526718.1 glycine--tRNA ligase subunit beta [Erythrobacter sp.]MBO6531059.1 glycine--tRNA ligase subunit beta [Erythrobacter sp.]
MSDFLLELRSEEIPARMQAGARAELEKLFRREMDAAGVETGAITVWSTPRRLALIARGLPEATEAVSEELKGPPVGAPDQAIDGFCRKAGVERGDLETREVKGRATYFGVKNIPGRATQDLLAEAIPAIIRDFSWPKSMRWGAASISTESLRWVRPLSGIVALLGDDVVECEVHGVTSGAVTLGHRFHHSGDITIGNADDYAMKLRAGHVIVDHEERQDLIRSGAAKVASEAGLTLVEDEGLVVENAGLTEWPVPLLGRFEEDFLEVPPETIQLTARVNQKYFVCTSSPDGGGGPRSGGGAPSADRDGSEQPNLPHHHPADGPPPRAGEARLANAFICTANIEAEDGGARMVDGNRKVLAARLSDARFFWDVDRKKTLAEHAKGLERITFHEKLGTVADKVERVAKLARWLVESDIVTPDLIRGGASSGAAEEKHAPGSGAGVTKEQLADWAQQAAELCKADLVTEMVGEFPELQGLMGGYYARAEGLPDEVADAIRDHYKPVGQGDDVPTAPVTVAVSLADKLDTLVGFFLIDEKPTGSKDPFALRRAALGILRLLQTNSLRMALGKATTVAISEHMLSALIADFEWHEHFGLQDTEDRNFWVDHTAEQPKLYYGDTLVFVSPTILKAYQYPSVDWEDDSDRGVLDFFADRLKVQQREAGVRHDLIDAVFALGGEDDLVRLLARVKALQSFMDTEDGANLLAGYKRAANILKKEDWHGVEGEIARTGEEDPLALVDDPDMKAVIDAKMAERHAKALSYTPEPAEKALMDALATSEPAAARAIEAEDFSGAMAALASLRAPIDRFFDEVTVNAEEENKRAHRLDLLAAFRAAVHKVADFSRIEG